MWQPYDDDLFGDDPDVGDIVWWTRFGFFDNQCEMLQFPYEVQRQLMSTYRSDLLYLGRR